MSQSVNIRKMVQHSDRGLSIKHLATGLVLAVLVLYLNPHCKTVNISPQTDSNSRVFVVICWNEIAKLVAGSAKTTMSN